MNIKNYRSKCCNAKVYVKMSPDFIGDDVKKMTVGTCCFICKKCKKACDVYLKEGKRKMNKKEWIEKLRPYWKKREEAYLRFCNEEAEIETQMIKDVGEELEFFYNDDGVCCGIGHSDFSRRDRKKKNYFPLIHDSELEVMKNEK